MFRWWLITKIILDTGIELQISDAVEMQAASICITYSVARGNFIQRERTYEWEAMFQSIILTFFAPFLLCSCCRKAEIYASDTRVCTEEPENVFPFLK